MEPAGSWGCQQHEHTGRDKVRLNESDRKDPRLGGADKERSVVAVRPARGPGRPSQGIPPWPPESQHRGRGDRPREYRPGRRSHSTGAGEAVPGNTAPAAGVTARGPGRPSPGIPPRPAGDTAQGQGRPVPGNTTPAAGVTA